MYVAYHNESDRKLKMVSAMQEHRRLDNIHQLATGGLSGKGCTVACAYQSAIGSWSQCYDHTALAEHLGVPEWLPRLADRIFESLPKKDATEFSEAWLDAIAVGSDVSAIREPLLTFFRHQAYAGMDKLLAQADIFEKELTKRGRYTPEIRECVESARAIGVLVTNSRSGNHPSDADWFAARFRASAAYSAAWGIYAAADAAAADAAAAAAAAADAAAAAAAAAAADAAAADAAAAAAAAADAAAAAAAAAAADGGLSWREFWDLRSDARQSARREFWQKASVELLKKLREAPLAVGTGEAVKP